MAKPKTPSLLPDASKVTLTYHLYDLPSTQHKAGLTGLILLIQTMKEREIMPVPEVSVHETEATFVFDEPAFKAVFAEWYAADLEEIEYQKKKSKGKGNAKTDIPPKREITKTELDKKGNTKEKTLFIYDEVIPRGGFFKYLLEQDQKGAWIKLWRNMLWQILRSQPAARGIYENAQNGEDIHQTLWQQLTDSKKKDKPIDLASSLFIGAQDSNAEQVPFQDSVQQSLLLHFWQLVTRIYAPKTIDVTKQTWKDEGFLLCIPEPSNLNDFIEALTDDLKRLSDDIFGFRPKEAIVDTPLEGGFEYLYALTQAKIEQSKTRYALSAVEIFHLEKKGNNVKVMDTKKIIAQPELLSEYGVIRKQYFNPFFKTIRLTNLFFQQPWYANADQYLLQLPASYFIVGEKTPRNIAFFSKDVRFQFKQFKQFDGGDMQDHDDDKKLSLIVRRLIKRYVRQRSEEKSNVKVKSLPKNAKGFPDYPSTYHKAVEKVCLDAFLAMRSRHDQDFINYFTGSIAAVPQYLPEKDFLTITQVLLDEPHKIKTLSMLALSAESCIGQTSSSGEQK